jgi:ribose-phosphate pyrophosphokinase
VSAALQCLPAAVDDAERLAARLGVPLKVIDVHRFPDGELKVTVGPATATTLLYLPLDAPNEKIITLLFAVEALRRDGARRIVLAAPYLCYMRQDTAFRPGEAISQKVIGPLLARNVDRVVTVDAHLHRTHDIRDVFPGIEAEDLTAMTAIAEHLRGTLDAGTVVVGPDEESEQWIGALAGRLGLDHIVGHKTRAGDRSVTIRFDGSERLRGRPALLVDDVASSGGTLITCARTLTAAGAAAIDCVVTHALFPPAMLDDFRRAGIRSVRSTTSVPHPTNAVRLDSLLADALRNEVTA